MNRKEGDKVSEIKELEEKECIVVNGTRFQIDSYIGEGSTCMVYYGSVLDGNGLISGTRVVIKEFVPKGDNIYVEREDSGKLKINPFSKDTKQYLNLQKQFQTGFENQKNLARIDKVMEVGITPIMEGQYGDSRYVISNIHSGTGLDRKQFKTLEEKLECAVRVIEMMGIFHEAGYVITDFKPENILYIDRPKAVKLIDFDSVLSINNTNENEASFTIDNLLYLNRKYCSKNFLQLFVDKIKNGEISFQEKRTAYINPRENIYALGAYLFELLFDRIPKEEVEQWEEVKLLEELQDKYEYELKRRELAAALLEVIKKAMQKRLKQRYYNGYEMMDALNQCIKEIYRKEYIPKKQVIQANATFAAYHMLQKYPLYEYITVDKKGNKHLKVVLYSNYAMRKEMLGAIISIGQMLETKLDIYLVSKDAEEFWNDYISKDNNFALPKAVIWNLNGEIISDNIDKQVVSQALAEINLITNDRELEDLVKNQKCRYFVLMEANRKKTIEAFETISSSEKCMFIAYLQQEESSNSILESNKENIVLHPISTVSFNEIYNERMFEERVYEMGLRVHAYYCDYINGNCDFAEIRKQLEPEFKKDMYNIQASERTAIHARYKMASIGINPNDLGFPVVHFYNKIQNVDTLEKLAWLEHMSWTAYFLTSGAYPISIEELDTYAYKNGNDWKNREDAKHTGHPLLAAAYPKRSLIDQKWNIEEDMNKLDSLDPLDKVSYGIYSWYCKQKPIFEENLREELSRWRRLIYEEFCRSSEVDLHYQNMLETGLACIEHIGEKTMKQSKKFSSQWGKSLKDTEDFMTELDENSGELKEILDKIKQVMKPVLDSYKDRDFKQIDSNLVIATTNLL